MTDLLPLFPLPNVVLFPNVFLPLHIFEPRYREMVADALAGDRMIGMVLLQPGWEPAYEGRPAVYPIGCSGVITHAERLPDGRFHIVLHGIERFRIVREDHARSYRRALVERLPDAGPSPDDRDRTATSRAKLDALIAPAVERAGADLRTTSTMADEDLVHALAQYLELRAARAPGPARGGERHRPRPGARRAPRDENADRADARSVEPGALITDGIVQGATCACWCNVQRAAGATCSGRAHMQVQGPCTHCARRFDTRHDGGL